MNRRSFIASIPAACAAAVAWAKRGPAPPATEGQAPAPYPWRDCDLAEPADLSALYKGFTITPEFAAEAGMTDNGDGTWSYVPDPEQPVREWNPRYTFRVK